MKEEGRRKKTPPRGEGRGKKEEGRKWFVVKDFSPYKLKNFRKGLKSSLRT
jgi:hypothetical protein